MPEVPVEVAHFDLPENAIPEVTDSLQIFKRVQIHPDLKILKIIKQFFVHGFFYRECQITSFPMV